MQTPQLEALIKTLDLVPLEPEGGYFAQTYCHTTNVPVKTGNIGVVETRPLATAIYYLITQTTFSAIHRVKHDEVFHFYVGAPVELFTISPLGATKTQILGSNILAGERPQIRVPGEFWQGLKLAGNGEFALLGTTMSPGFDMKDFELGKAEALFQTFPNHKEEIAKFLPKS